MTEKVKQALSAYSEERGLGFDESNPLSLLGILECLNLVDRKEIKQCRWWNKYQYTVKVGDIYVGYIYAEANRDETVKELGYEFDPSTICEMRPVQKTITVYEPA